jgi:integrase
MKITKRIIDAAEVKDKTYELWDDEVKGFALRIYPSGIKSYMIQYRSEGRTRKYTIGKHGVLTPDEARKLAREYLVEVVKGGNPAQEKQLYADAPTLGDFCDHFLEKYAKPKLKSSTYKEYVRAVDIFIKPNIGNYKIQDIVRADIAKLHQQYSNIAFQANRTRGVLSRIFNVAEELGLRPDNSNPVTKVKPYPEIRRERYLTPDEIKELGLVFRACLAGKLETEYMIAAFKLLILTGCRLGEIQTMKWSYIQGNALMLPDSKTGKKKVYLGQAALDVLTEIKRKDDNEYVICGKLEGAYITDFQKPWRRIRSYAGIEDVRIHDLRHSFASGAVSMGESLPMIGKLLGHDHVQTTARYAHLADAPMHEAADRVSDAIAKTLNG